MRRFSIPILLVAATLVACEEKPTPPSSQPVVTPNPTRAMAAGTDAGSGATQGKVIETMDSGGYTYVRIDDGAKQIWAAAPQFAVSVGELVTVPAGMAMKNFESKTLGRTFDVVYFVNAVHKGLTVPSAPEAQSDAPAAPHPPGGPAMPGHPPVGPAADGLPEITSPAAPNLSFDGLKKAEGGQTVAEIYANEASLTGKEVVVRAKVAKFNANIMGKNWIHLQDGTGTGPTADVTVTTQDTAEVGQTVLVRGQLAADLDFGFGYTYDLLIQDATVEAE